MEKLIDGLKIATGKADRGLDAIILEQDGQGAEIMAATDGQIMLVTETADNAQAEVFKGHIDPKTLRTHPAHEKRFMTPDFRSVMAEKKLPTVTLGLDQLEKIVKSLKKACSARKRRDPVAIEIQITGLHAPVRFDVAGEDVGKCDQNTEGTLKSITGIVMPVRDATRRM